MTAWCLSGTPAPGTTPAGTGKSNAVNWCNAPALALQQEHLPQHDDWRICPAILTAGLPGSKTIVYKINCAAKWPAMCLAGATASVPVTEFWKALPSAFYSPQERILRLPAGISWLALATEDIGLYVRECYDDLWSIIMDLFAKLPKGTP